VTQLPNTPDKLRQLIEQAQAKLEKLESRPVPCESDGWIDWAGGECPVDEHQVVRAKLRDGGMSRGRAGDYAWFHDGPEHWQGNCDIVAYRVEEEDG
jgi:hypothetical protein